MAFQKLEINIANQNGPIRHGACGFLYGLGNDGVPNLNMLIPLKPAVVAQKPPDGLQHPNGDCFDVVDTFEKAGGKQIQIYMQDIYAKWPYESQDINDYLDKVEKIVRAVLNHPRRKMFAYVPFNEPDWIWYNVDERKEPFFNDWRTVYRKIRSLDPTGIIVGPNNAKYHQDFYEDFMRFCQLGHCLPDIISWHELEPNFFSEWYQHYNHYRSIEKKIGISEMPVCINEYANWRDLSVPGRLVQWIARLENCKVDGCLAYWHAAGNLDDLVTQNNQATGAWWLFKWYGDLTGNTVNVVPPDVNSEGLQGLAAFDKDKKQIRVLFGGTSGNCEIKVEGFKGVPVFDSKVGVKVWSVAWSGQEGPTAGPFVEMTGNYPINDGIVTIPVRGMDAASAYYLIIDRDMVFVNSQVMNSWVATLEAEEAELTDCNIIMGGTETHPNQNYHSNLQRVGAIEKDTSKVRFTVDIPLTGIYLLDIFYGNGHGSMAQQLLYIDDSNYQMVNYHPNLAWGFIDRKPLLIELTAGTHTLTFAKYDPALGRANLSADLDKIELRYIDPKEKPERYEAQYADILGSARIDNRTSDNSRKAHVVLDGEHNSGLRFWVSAPSSGYYHLKVRFTGTADVQIVTGSMIKLNINDTSIEVPCQDLLGQKDCKDGECRIFLPAGINQIAFWGAENGKIAIEYIELMTDLGKHPQTYEAEAPENTLNGTVKIYQDEYASGCQYVGGIGKGAENFLQYNQVIVDADGIYSMIIYYSNAEKIGDHQYNVNIVDRYVDISVNDGEAQRVYFRNTFGWNSYRSKVVQIQLKKGANTIRFFNCQATGPHIDKIEIAPFQLA